MGAWGPGIFENDSALDWTHDLAESWGDTLLRTTLKAALEPDAAFDSIGSDLLAAAYVVCRLGGQPTPELPENAADWAAAQSFKPSAALVKLATDAVQRLLSPEAGMEEIWFEPEDYKVWKAGAEGVLSALGQIGRGGGAGPGQWLKSLFGKPKAGG